MFWAGISSRKPIHVTSSPVSSPWEPTWGFGRWRRYRTAIPRPPQEDGQPGRRSPPQPLCWQPDQAKPQDPRCLDRSGMAEYPADRGVSDAEGRDAGDRRAQTKLVHPAERDQEGAVGDGQHPAYQILTRLHRRCLLYTSDAADDLLCVDLG